MSKGGWHLWSTRANGVLMTAQAVERLPKAAVVSADGLWAELSDEKGVERVFMRVVEPATARRKKVA